MLALSSIPIVHILRSFVQDRAPETISDLRSNIQELTYEYM